MQLYGTLGSTSTTGARVDGLGWARDGGTLHMSQAVPGIAQSMAHPVSVGTELEWAPEWKKSTVKQDSCQWKLGVFTVDILTLQIPTATAQTETAAAAQPSKGNLMHVWLISFHEATSLLCGRIYVSMRVRWNPGLPRKDCACDRCCTIPRCLADVRVAIVGLCFDSESFMEDQEKVVVVGVGQSSSPSFSTWNEGRAIGLWMGTYSCTESPASVTTNPWDSSDPVLAWTGW